MPHKPTSAAWPDSSFVESDDDTAHMFHAHWWPLLDDTTELSTRLPDIIAAALPQTGWGDTRPAPRPCPADWPSGLLTVWPQRTHGMATVFDVSNPQSELVSVFPFYAQGSQQTLTLQTVHVCPNRLEAWITAEWGDAIVSFFDTQFSLNRLWYEAGREYDFIMTGIAYTASPVSFSGLTDDSDPDSFAGLNQILQEIDPHTAPIEVISLADASIFLPPGRCPG